jgi:hypothetical protein
MKWQVMMHLNKKLDQNNDSEGYLPERGAQRTHRM